MDFFNSLGEVVKNRKNFKTWEENQKNQDAQREELAKRRQHSEERLQAAKAYGEKIIDIVDIMDNHSENVSENVETALAPMASLATMGTALGGGALYVKKVVSPAENKLREIRKDIVQSDEAADLAKRIRENAKKSGKELYFDSWDLTSKNRIGKIKDVELRKEAQKMFDGYKKAKKPVINKMVRGGVGLGIATVVAFVVSTIFTSKLQTDSSKIARYQARKDLEDPKAFVMYTPEQIEAAKQELKDHPELLKEKKKSKLKSGMIGSIANIFKDRRDYKNDKAARTDDSQKVSRQLSEQEIINAKKDQEVIQRTVRKINNEAEKYSENMEVAANVIMGATPILGLTVGKGINWILQKTGVIQKFVQKQVDNYGTDEAKKLYKNFKELKDDAPGYHRKWGDFAGEFLDGAMKEELKEGLDKAKKPKKVDVGEIVKKFSALGFSHKWGRNWIVAIIGGVATGFAGLMIGLKLQKSAARAGRFTAKRELEKNPENFIGYSEEDYKEVQDVKTNKKNPNKIKEYALFVPNVLKQYFAYNKFRKTEYKEKQVLNELLKKQEVTEAQLKDAKNLQRKIFNTFEKVDDKSQVYSESMEAATQIAQPFIWYGGMAAAAAPIVYGTVQLFKHPAKTTNKLLSKLSSGSEIMQKKWFKKYLDKIPANISDRTESIKVEHQPLSTLTKGLDLKNKSVLELIGQISDNVQTSADFRKLDDRQQISAIYDLQELLSKAENIPFVQIPEGYTSFIKDVFPKMRYGSLDVRMTPELRADAMDAIFNPSAFEKIPEERIEMVDKLFRSMKPENRDFLGSISQYLDLGSFVKGIDIKSPEFAALKKGYIDNFITNGLNEAGKVEIPLSQIELAEKVSGKTFDNLRNLANKNKSKIVDPDELLQQLTDRKISYEEFQEGCRRFETQKSPHATVSVEDAEKFYNDVIDKISTNKIADFIPAKIKNSEQLFGSLKTKIAAMTEDDIADLADTLNLSDLNKQMLTEMVPKIEKIFNNLPKAEAQKILDTMMKEITEHPDQFFKLALSRKASQMLITPELQKALAVAGVSWTAFTFIMTYAVEAFMADLQLKAGRLGVMKAMEGLQDPTYYANVEPTETTFTSGDKTAKPSETIAQNKDLLARFKK